MSRLEFDLGRHGYEFNTLPDYGDFRNSRDFIFTDIITSYCIISEA